MRITHFVHNFPPEFVGGTEAYLAALVREQQRCGDEPCVITGSEVSGGGVVEETFHGIPVTRLRSDPLNEPFGIRHEFARTSAFIAARLGESRPDVVHVHHWFHLAAPIVALAHERGIPAIVSLHDYFSLCPRFFLVQPSGAYCGDAVPVPRQRCVECVAPDLGAPPEHLAAEFEQRAAFFRNELALAKARLAPSSLAASMYARTGILTQDGVTPGIEVLPLGLLEPIKPVPRQVDENGRLRLVFFGNVAPVKGLDDLIAAIDALTPPERAKLELRILGRGTDDALEARLSAAATRFASIRETSFERARLERLPAEADLAVFPSRAAETYSLVVDEALALGLPLIVTDRGAMAERAGAAALVVRSGNVADLKSCLSKLLKHRDLLDDLRRVGKKRVFTIADHAKRLREIYSGP